MTTRRGVFWPLLFIVLGVVFLLANFGYIPPVSLVALASLWPLLLILAGIDIAFGRRWPLAALVADAVILAGGLAFIAAYPSGIGGGAPFLVAGTGESSVSAPREAAKTMQLRIAGGAGTYNVSGAAQAELLRADSTRGDLRLRTSTRGDVAELRLDQGSFEGVRVGPSFPGTVNATIADDVPTSLTVDVGAGEFVIDLSKVRVTDARVSAGAASVTVTLPSPTGDVPITVSAGASNVVIVVPPTVEARITTSGGLTSTHVENPRFASGETSGYQAAKDRVTIRVSTGASSVTVR